MPEAFYDAMDRVLAGDGAALDPWLADAEAGRAALAVYRNTVAKARVDALAALYPTVERLVGRDWFREAALIFTRETPPESSVMDAYGDGFPDWLVAFPPARDLPYLAPIARIDRAWSQSHRAADAPVLEARAVSGVAARRLFGARARLHPSACLFWFDWTVASVWLANRPDGDPVDAVVWDQQSEGLVLVRPRSEVRHYRMDRDQWLFLDACRGGLPLGRAAAAVMIEVPLTEVSSLFAGLLGLGVFTSLELETP